MKRLYQLIKFVFCILSSLYLTNILFANVLTTKLQEVFVFTYFVVIGLIIWFFYDKILSKKIDLINKKKILVLSLLLTIAILYCLGNSIFPRQYINTDITISSSDGKNLNALGNEIWITEVNVDDKAINLADLRLNTGWIYKTDANAIYADLSDMTFEPLSINVKKANTLKIQFVKHSWSGVIEINDGTKNEIVDLYDKSGSSFVYTADANTKNISVGIKIFSIISLGVLIYSLCNIFLLITHKKHNRLFILSLAFLLIVFNTLDKWYNSKFDFLYISGIVFIHYFFFKIIKKEVMQKYYKKSSIALIVFVNFYITFSFFGELIFLPINKSSINYKDIIIFTLLFLVMIPVDFCILYGYELIHNKLFHNIIEKKPDNTKKIIVLISGIISLIYTSIFLYLFNILINVSINDLLLIILFDIIVGAIIVTASYIVVINILKILLCNNDKGIRHLFVLMVSITFMVESLTLLILNPGLMTSDSFDQYAQAHGLLQFNDHHPIFHTFCEKILYSLWDNPLCISIAQIMLFSIIIAFAGSVLYKNGINNKIILLYTIFNSLIPNNNVNSVTLWKDIPFSFALLALTVLLAKRVYEKKEFYDNIPNLFLCILIISSIGLLRHNGFIVVFGMLIFFLLEVFTIKSLKPLIIGVISVITFVGVGNYLSNHLNATPNGSLASIIPIHGIAYVNYMDKKIDNDVIEYMEDYMPLYEWKDLYEAHSANSYMFSETAIKYQTMAHYRQADLKEVITLYLKTFIDYPYLIIKDRLYGTDVLWNVKQWQGYTYRNTNLDDISNNEYGIIHAENNLSGIYFDLMNLSSKSLFDIFIWRVGIYIDLLLLLFCFAIINKKREKLLCMVPIILNIGSLFIGMAWQEYRYVYNVFLCFGFIVIFSLHKPNDNIKYNIRDKYVKI